MRNQLSIALVAVALAMTGCRDDSDVTRKDQQSYETVQEGSAAGVTSDLGTAGIPPAAPVTSTNVDTTSAFTLQTGTFQPADPRTLGGTMQPGAPPSGAPSYPQATARPRTPAPPPRIATDTRPSAPESAPRPDPAPMTSAAPQPPPPPSSDTASASDPAPEPAAEPEEEQEEEQEEPKQDEPAPPPPPPGF